MQPPPTTKPLNKHKDKNDDKNIQVNKNILFKKLKKKTSLKEEINYNIISHLRNIPTQLSVYKDLLMSKDVRKTLMQALKNSERYEAYLLSNA